MLGSVLALALLTSLNPLRVGCTLLVISRSRPVQNLLAFWVGCVTVSLTGVLATLTLLHVKPMFKSFAQGWATSSTGRHIQIGMGVLMLSIAALMTVRVLARQRAQLSTPGRIGSTLTRDSNTPTEISWLLGRVQKAATEGGSAIRRLLGHIHNAWEKGSWWVAFVIGMGFGGPQPDEIVYVVAIIVASGAAIGIQVSAAIAYVLGTLAVVEITLVSYLATPAKTQAVVRVLHDWVLAHRLQILVAILTVVGVSLVANGVGIA